MSDNKNNKEIYKLLSTLTPEEWEENHCGRVGDDCLNQRYGRFCIAVVYRYYRANRNGRLSVVEAVERFKQAYQMGYDRDLFCRNAFLTRSEGLELPGCLEARSLIFAINLMTWEIMVNDSIKAAGYFAKKK